jgi:hypothetical protein
MTRTIPGTVCSGAVFLFLCVCPVSIYKYTNIPLIRRHINTFSRLRAPSKKSRRLLGRATRAFMGWHKLQWLQLLMSPLRYICVIIHETLIKLVAGSIFSVFITRFLQDGYDHRFGEVLHLSFRPFRGCRGDTRSQWTSNVVESVCVFFSHVQIAYKRMLCSQVFPNFSSARRTICKNSALARIKAKRAELRSIGNNSTWHDTFYSMMKCDVSTPKFAMAYIYLACSQ